MESERLVQDISTKYRKPAIPLGIQTSAWDRLFQEMNKDWLEQDWWSDYTTYEYGGSDTN